MDSIFEDKIGRIILLPADRIKHIYKHPEMQNRIYLVEKTIREYDFIEEDLNISKSIYYYKYFKEFKRNIMVVVKLKENCGYILTAYMVEK
ncbi:MAG: hypothetical protein AABX19_00080 [Nanoarchaeota archaeon]